MPLNWSTIRYMARASGTLESKLVLITIMKEKLDA